jgi:hypothetical protein
MRIIHSGGYAKNGNSAIAIREGLPTVKRLQPPSHHEDTKGHEEGQKQKGEMFRWLSVKPSRRRLSSATKPIFISYFLAFLRAPFVFFVSSW